MKQIRRLQLNFSPESGYDTALNALQGLNLPIRDKNRPVIQPTPAPPEDLSSLINICSHRHNLPGCYRVRNLPIGQTLPMALIIDRPAQLLIGTPSALTRLRIQ